MKNLSTFSYYLAVGMNIFAAAVANAFDHIAFVKDLELESADRRCDFAFVFDTPLMMGLFVDDEGSSRIHALGRAVSLYDVSWKKVVSPPNFSGKCAFHFLDVKDPARAVEYIKSAWKGRGFGSSQHYVITLDRHEDINNYFNISEAIDFQRIYFLIEQVVL